MQTRTENGRCLSRLKVSSLGSFHVLRILMRTISESGGSGDILVYHVTLISGVFGSL